MSQAVEDGVLHAAAASPRVDTTDIVVVGAGGAGLMAAAEARKLGRRVVLLEKGNRIGGTTTLAVGSIMAARTAMQRRECRGSTGMTSHGRREPGDK